MPLPSASPRERIAREAAGWLAKWQAGTLDEAAFEAWRGADPAHAVAFARALAIWQQAGAAPAPAPETAPAPAPARRVAGLAALVGAGLLLAAGGFGARAFAWQSAQSVVGQSLSVALAPAAHAQLNTNSRISWRFSGAERHVWLEAGEMALDIATPTLLDCGGEQVWLASGQYNARIRAGACNILVLGHGGSARTAEGIAAGPQQNLLIAGGHPAARAASALEVAQVEAWPKGEILFEGLALSAAVDEYNRYLTRKITIVDPDLAGIAVGGRFTTTDPAAFLSALQLGIGVKVVPSANGYLVTR
ncbi:MAG TPA: DUF4880 domain-containing protein [Novosphingobium sp.]|nr:DUF4880 domain-containing protein [Novosphingobium sp.]HZV09396.1 DUF4880 domain-containing protein [Novosphingobium sp.]